MSQIAASLELHSDIITHNSDPDALAASLDAVASLRSAIACCKGLRAHGTLAPSLERIIHFVAEACTQGFPGPAPDFDVAWRLLTTAIACGLELLEICSPEETLSSACWAHHLNIWAKSLDVLKAKP